MTLMERQRQDRPRFVRDVRKYAESQPRVPAGSPEGGEFAAGDTPMAPVDLTRFQALARDRSSDGQTNDVIDRGLKQRGVTVVPDGYRIKQVALDWARNATLTGSVALMEAARERYGAPTNDYYERNYLRSWLNAVTPDDLAPWRARANTVLDIVDENRARLFKGLDEDALVPVYRGLHSDRGTAAPDMGETVRMVTNPLSSWTVDQKEARDFGDYVVRAEVPLRRIVSVGAAGLGNGYHAEAVLSGGDVMATRVEPFPRQVQP